MVFALGRYAYQRKHYKYNPHHGAGGRFTTSDEAVLHVARDGTRTLGPKHPDNQKIDPLKQMNVHPTQKWTDEYQENTKVRLEMYSEYHDMTVNEYTKAIDTQIQTIAKASSLFTRVKPSTLQKILDGGRFKSQFETNTSGGTVGKDIRDRFESGAFSFDEAKQGVEKRPIYGYLSQDVHGENTDADVSQYGNIAVEMKPSVGDRTTITFGDSLTMTAGGHYESVLPQPVNAPNHSVYPIYNGIDPLNSPKAKYHYIETQMHGGVKSSDIQSVTFHGKAPTGKLKKALNDAGIPFHVK